jgi:hypothetical protein
MRQSRALENTWRFIPHGSMQSKWSPERIAQQIVTAAVEASGQEGFNGAAVEVSTSESGRVDPADPHEDDSWAVAVCAEPIRNTYDISTQ